MTAITSSTHNIWEAIHIILRRPLFEHLCMGVATSFPVKRIIMIFTTAAIVLNGAKRARAWTMLPHIHGMRQWNHRSVGHSTAPLLSRPPMSTTTLRMTGDATLPSAKKASEKPEERINLHTISLVDLEDVLVNWGYPKYRAKQIKGWVHDHGVTSIEEMQNIPKKLKEKLSQNSAIGTLQLDGELISKDGTIKRSYLLSDGQRIESVLMPYTDGRYTACISSQAGCAMGCVFCATGQMGFSRQLSAGEIFEQVSRFAAELAAQEKEENRAKSNSESNQTPKSHGRTTRLSNIVFMGMGEPLMNYKNVKAAIHRIQRELGIGHRRITVSTVGILPNIDRLADDLPQVRLAVSLHSAKDDERSALMPVNKRYGGLDRLMQRLQEYQQKTGKRITLEWALIERKNDNAEAAHTLGKLLRQWLRMDMVHINVIPLNPTGGFGGNPSSRERVDAFCKILQSTYHVACTPRVRRGIDIDAGCGQLKAEIERRRRLNNQASAPTAKPPQSDSPSIDDGEDIIIPDDWSLDDWMQKIEEEEVGEDDYEDPTSTPLPSTNSEPNRRVSR
eukprot:Nitzschia sp. Nitz4//scaffold105_size73764//59408//61164//NITZ4_005684-RA/size73764-augustus-gene-0.53-mRNA-1//1//CDS//3329532471//283//frame0